MCLALYKPAKAKLSQDEMRTAFAANPDGAGFAYYDPALKRVIIQRGYFTFDSLWTDLQPIMDDNCPLILHFRWATHGDVNVENCHPFQLTDGALIHNGVISGMGTKTSYSKYYTPPSDKCVTACSDDRSDTREFVEDYLADMGVLELMAAKKLIEHTIGYSKLVTIHNDGSVVIFNEQMGHWRSGVWYSNDSYKPYKAASANPANLKPYTPSKDIKYDYHGKADDVPTEYDEGDYSDPLSCTYCDNHDNHAYTYDPVDDSFLIECSECGNAWIVEGETLDNETYNSLYYLCMNQTTEGDK